MKTILKRQGDNVVLVTRDDKGIDTVIGDCPITKDGICYKLPENELNRKWYTVKKFEGKDEAELSEHIDRTQSSGKKLEDYLTEEEKATIAKIMEAAKARKDADKPSDKEKKILAARKQLEKYNKMLAELEANN